MRKYVITHMLTHWNKEISLKYTQATKLIHKLLTIMSPEKETKFGITFGQLYAIGSMIIAIFAAWIQVNIRITTIEVDQRNDKALILKAVDQYTKIDDKLEVTNNALNQLIGAVNTSNNKNLD